MSDPDEILRRIQGTPLETLREVYVQSNQYEDWLNCIRGCVLLYCKGAACDINVTRRIIGDPEDTAITGEGRCDFYFHANRGGDSKLDLVTQVSFDQTGQVAGYLENQRGFMCPSGHHPQNNPPPPSPK